MFADIVPVLAAAANLSADEADSSFAAAYQNSVQENGGVRNTKTFTDAVLMFRAAYPFDLGMLSAARRAKDDIDASR